MRPPPCTVEVIEALALQQPGRPALREDDAELNYAQFHGVLQQCGLALLRLGLRPGERVAVSGPGFAIQLALLLASEALGAATASFQAEGDVDAPALFRQVQWVFSARPQAVPPGVRFVQVDDAFARALLAPAGERPQWAPAELDAIQRISRTSGSSGTSKLMLLQRRAQEQWIRNGCDPGQYGPHTRLLMLGPLVINAAFTRSSAVLRNGGMVLNGSGRFIEALAPTHVYGLPLQLERLLAELPPGYVAPRPVAVATVGGLVSRALRQRTAAVFGGAIGNRYGCNEAGSICDDLDADGRGVLVPGVDVRILGPQGQDLPAGEAGVVAVRTPCMAEGYLERPQESAAAFRDGWFVTGDVGTLVGPRTLQLAGRHDDLIVVGGIKLPAAQLEAALRRSASIADCCVLAANLPGGVTVGVAVVLAPGAQPSQAEAALRQALQQAPGLQARWFVLPALPMLATDKVDRMGLLRAMQNL